MVTISASVLGTGSALPLRVVTSDELAASMSAERSSSWIVEKTGIHARRWSEPGTTHAMLASEAVASALRDAGLPPSKLSRLILASSDGGDRRGPGTANDVLRELGVHDSCGALDLNNGCTGFVTALDLGARLVATGAGYVGVVAVERLSAHLSPDDPRTYVLFGDAAGAAILGPTSGNSGVLAAAFANDGRNVDALALGHGADARMRFGESAEGIARLALRDVRTTVDAVLAASGVPMAKVDYVVLHQPNGRMLELMLQKLGVERERTEWIVDEFGSLGSASVAVAFDRLWHTRRPREGQLVLVCAVGIGSSRGALLLRA